METKGEATFFFSHFWLFHAARSLFAISAYIFGEMQVKHEMKSI